MIREQLIERFGKETLLKVLSITPENEPIFISLGRNVEDLDESEIGSVLQFDLVDFNAYLNTNKIDRLSENMLANIENYFNIINHFHKIFE